MTHCWSFGGWGGGEAPTSRAVVEGGKKSLRNASINEHLWGRNLLHGHGTFSTSKVGGWRLVVGGSWQLEVGGGWQLVVDGGWRLAVGGLRGLSLTKTFGASEGQPCPQVEPPFRRITDPLNKGFRQLQNHNPPQLVKYFV